MDIITKLRQPKIEIMENLNISIFDLTASYLGIYVVSKYIFDIRRPAITSVLAVLPVSYLVHEYFNVQSPFNNYINGTEANQPDPNLVQPQVPLPPIDFQTMNIPTQMYIQQRTESKNQVFDEQNNLMQPVKYEKLR